MATRLPAAEISIKGVADNIPAKIVNNDYSTTVGTLGSKARWRKLPRATRNRAST